MSMNALQTHTNQISVVQPGRKQKRLQMRQHHGMLLTLTATLNSVINADITQAVQTVVLRGCR